MPTRILIAFGTRPEIIKLGPVYQALRNRRDVQIEVFWTGQHIELARGLLDLFGIAVTHNGAEVMNQPGMASKFALMMQQIEAVLGNGGYDWIVVQGDTATAAAAATAGFFNRVPVAHVEAGLRTGDLASPWPEEFNRRVITLASALHFAPTVRAAENLRAEGVRDANIMVVGNTVVDALLFVSKRIANAYQPIDPMLSNLPPEKKLILATLHRRENIGAPMREVLRALRTLAADGDKLIALPLHLNPDVRKEVMSVLGGALNVRMLAPLQYPDFVYLLRRAWVVVTDSGGVQEEAPTFGLPILITRDTTERPEVIEAGFGRLVGADYQRIVNEVRALTASDHPQRVSGRNPFGTGDASERIAEALLLRHGRAARAMVFSA
jgi:UDP-N-acetylglucosamine 2-epimerase